MPRRTLYLLPTYKVGCSKLKYQAGGDCAEKALSTALCGLKAQQVPSPGQRPGCHCPHSLRPVRAKVKANRSPILLPLQGVGVYTLTPRALPWAGDWQPFQGTPFAICSFIMCVCFATYCLAKKRADIFWILNTLLKGTSEAFATCIHQQTL